MKSSLRRAAGTLLGSTLMIGALSIVPAAAVPAAVGPVSAADASGSGFLDNGVTAHRGYSGAYPENTVTAEKQGMAVGADWIELDVFLSKDGEVVVSHDRTTARMGDRNLTIADSTYAELRTVDVAWGFRDAHGLTTKEVPVERMPLLEDILKLVKKQDHTRVSIQPKETEVVDAAVGIVQRLGMQEWVGFNDGNLTLMSRVKELDPDIHVFWDTSATADVDESVATALDRGFESIVMNQAAVSPESIATIQDAGLEAGAWTINDFAVMQRFVDWGIDRVYTDYAAEALLLFGEDDRAGLEHGLLGHWSFDENRGGRADDDGSVNPLRDGRLIANAEHDRRGKLRGAVGLHGHRDYVDVPIEVIPDGAAAYTASAWFKPARAGVAWRQSVLETSGSWAISVELTADTGRLKYGVETDGTSVVAESDVVPEPGRWHHVAVAYDRAAGQTRLYLDGVEVTSFPHDAKEIVDGSITATDGLHVGAYRDAEDRYFDGSIDDVAVWNRALSTADLDRIWNDGRGRPVIGGHRGH